MRAELFAGERRGAALQHMFSSNWALKVNNRAASTIFDAGSSVLRDRVGALLCRTLEYDIC